MKHKIQTALGFDRSDWFTLLQAWFWLLAMELALRVLPFARVQAFASQLNRRASIADVTTAVRLVNRSINVASRNHLYPMTCLRQALTLQRMLGQNGVASDLRIGVRRENGALEAHAWVECGGMVIGAAVEMVDGFTPLSIARSG